MLNQYPYPAFDAQQSLKTGILLILITMGIYIFFWKRKQKRILNAWVGRNEFRFGKGFLLTIVTLGFYFFYQEYKIGQVINEIQRKNKFRVKSNLPVVCFLLGPIIARFIQQRHINEFYIKRSEA